VHLTGDSLRCSYLVSLGTVLGPGRRNDICVVVGRSVQVGRGRTGRSVVPVRAGCDAVQDASSSSTAAAARRRRSADAQLHQVGRDVGSQPSRGAQS